MQDVEAFQLYNHFKEVVWDALGLKETGSGSILHLASIYLYVA